MSFSDADIRAIVKAGQYSDSKDAETIAKALSERRDMIVRYWLTRSNPLDGFTISGGKLFFKDLAVESGFADKAGTVYSVEVASDDPKEKPTSLKVTEPSVSLVPRWIRENGEARLLIRVERAASKKLSPAVTVRWNAAGIQGIRHED